MLEAASAKLDSVEATKIVPKRAGRKPIPKHLSPFRAKQAKASALDKAREHFDSLKKLIDECALDPEFVCEMDRDPAVGKIGRIIYPVRVVQVISKDELLIDAPLTEKGNGLMWVWLAGFATDKAADDQRFGIDGALIVHGP